MILLIFFSTAAISLQRSFGLFNRKSIIVDTSEETPVCEQSDITLKSLSVNNGTTRPLRRQNIRKRR